MKIDAPFIVVCLCSLVVSFALFVEKNKTTELEAEIERLKSEPVRWLHEPKIITERPGRICYGWYVNFPYDNWGERQITRCRRT